MNNIKFLISSSGTLLSICFFLLSSCNYNLPENYNWTQYRNDAGRTGYSAQQLSGNLAPRWIYNFAIPDKSWNGVDTRMIFDHAYHPVIAGKILYVGNSKDNKIYALDRKTGDIIWTFYTEGPVRFAPAVYKNRLYAVSDDGYLYCLNKQNGKLIWKKYGSPKEDLIIGNDKIISRWPARGGLVIKDGILYFGAGIWPSEKIFIYALNPDNGDVLWENNSSGEIEMPQPHPTAVAKSGISAQGYFTIGGSKLFIPTGRAVPAALDLKSGEMEYFHLQQYRNIGGASIMATDSFLFVPSGNSRDMNIISGPNFALFNNNDGSIIQTEIKSEAIAISPEYIYCVNNENNHIEAYSTKNIITTKETLDRRGETVSYKVLSDPVWSAEILKDNVKSLIVTKNRLIAGTSTEKVLIFDSTDGRLVSSYKVNGVPMGLAVAHKALFVSTDKGVLYCFDENYGRPPKVHSNEFIKLHFDSDSDCIKIADNIIKESDVNKGYCLDIECGDGSLIYELARKTNLKIIALTNDEKNIFNLREKLNAAGLYGSRVVVFQGDINSVPLPDYFANLIISQKCLLNGDPLTVSSNIKRCQRPDGGVIIESYTAGKIALNIREKLKGVGEWTHQYHDPANTAVSDDITLNGKLEMLWFKDSDFEMPARHGRGVAPLYKDGRLFVAGVNGIRAVDAYNGQILWEHFIDNLASEFDQEHNMGAAITQGNWCIEGDKIFVRRGLSKYRRAATGCYVIDTKTGSRVATFNAPEGYWGYIAAKNGTLFGTVANTEHIVVRGHREMSESNNQFSESGSVFAMDISNGEILWEYKAAHSIRHNTITIGNDKIYFIDRPVADIDRMYRRGVVQEHKAGTLVALDARTGKKLFHNSDDIWGTLLILNEKYNRIIMSYNDVRLSLPSERGGKIAVFDSNTGMKIWESSTRQNLPDNYLSSGRSRPLVNDTIIFYEPETFNLFTGNVVNNNFQRSYGCGIISGSKNMLFFRSATIGYYWLNNTDAGVQNYGGIKPGCWINMIPAGGLVLMPDATSRCDCSYLMKSWIALKPVKDADFIL